MNCIRFVFAANQTFRDVRIKTKFVGFRSLIPTQNHKKLDFREYLWLLVSNDDDLLSFPCSSSRIHRYNGYKAGLASNPREDSPGETSF